MRVVIAIDSFKGSMTALEAGKAVYEGIKRVYADAAVDICPIADGGEGMVKAVLTGSHIWGKRRLAS